MSNQELRNKDGELLSVTQGLRTCAKYLIDVLDSEWARAVADLRTEDAARLDTMRQEARAALHIASEPLDWSTCPCCGADAQDAYYDTVEIEEGDALQKVTCHKCEATWGEWYRADERVVYDEGTKKTPTE